MRTPRNSIARPTLDARTRRVLAGAAYCTAFVTAPAFAQIAGEAPRPALAAADARWQAWYGCWTPTADSADAPDAAGAPVTCVSPAGGSAVELTTVTAGKVAARERVVADGTRRPFDRDGCTGWERATWSADGQRVYLRSELTCTGNVRRTGDGVLAFAGPAEWLDVRAAGVGGYTGVRSVRYRLASTPAALPADVAAALEARTLAAESARLAAAAPVSGAAVIDATRAAGGSVTAAWLAELRQRFALDARQLVGLADAGVPGSVTDVMIATSNPRVFAVGPSGAGRTPAAVADARSAGRFGPSAVAMYPPFGWGGFGGSAFGWNALGYNAGYGGVYPGLGFNPGFYPGGWWGAGPVVVVRPTGGGEGARLVRGRGYTRGDTPVSGSANSDARSGFGDARASAGSGGYTPSGAASSGSSSGGSSGSGRTAKPRP